MATLALTGLTSLVCGKACAERVSVELRADGQGMEGLGWGGGYQIEPIKMLDGYPVKLGYAIKSEL